MVVAKMLKEISRVLKIGGYYIIISYGQPENRMIHLERDHLAFEIQIYTIKRQEDDQEKIHYVYICKKLPEAKENINNFDLVYKELEQEELEGEEDDEEQQGEDDNNGEEDNQEYLPPVDDKKD
jgi:ubiquinone/menaquinone biosynthesis C-methylase UbiE